MTVRIGSITFEGWRSFPLAENRWSDTVVFPLSAHDGLPPGDYANLLKSMLQPAARLRRSLSVWVPLQAPPGKWFAAELRRGLKGSRLPVAVTSGDIPKINDFSFMPWTECIPSPALPQAEDLFPAHLSIQELNCLRALARMETAYTAEVASQAGISIPSARQTLKELVKVSLVARQTDQYPYWAITRRGVSSALRSWGVPKGFSAPPWKERRSGGAMKAIARSGIARVGRHLRTSRLWLAWLRRAWPPVEIWTGWSEVTLGRLRPDALAWGRLNGAETLFWLEVESAHTTRAQLSQRLNERHNKALIYARTFPVNLVFVVLSQPWIGKAVAYGFENLTEKSAIVLADWRAFGTLPVPVWGCVVR